MLTILQWQRIAAENVEEQKGADHDLCRVKAVFPEQQTWTFEALLYYVSEYTGGQYKGHPIQHDQSMSPFYKS